MKICRGIRGGGVQPRQHAGGGLADSITEKPQNIRKKIRNITKFGAISQKNVAICIIVLHVLHFIEDWFYKTRCSLVSAAFTRDFLSNQLTLKGISLINLKTEKFYRISFLKSIEKRKENKRKKDIKEGRGEEKREKEARKRRKKINKKKERKRKKREKKLKKKR